MSTVCPIRNETLAHLNVNLSTAADVIVLLLLHYRSDAVELTKAALPQTSIFVIDLGESKVVYPSCMSDLSAF
jgi:hypothetical protein